MNTWWHLTKSWQTMLIRSCTLWTCFVWGLELPQLPRLTFPAPDLMAISRSGHQQPRVKRGKGRTGSNWEVFFPRFKERPSLLSNVTDFKGRFMTGLFNPIDLHFLARGRRGHCLIMHISCRSEQTGCSPNRYEGNSERNRYVKILVLIMANTVNKILGIYTRIQKCYCFFFCGTSLIPSNLLSWMPQLFIQIALSVSIFHILSP